LVSGPVLPEIIVIFTGVNFLFKERSNITTYFKSNFSIIFFLFYLCLIISSIFSPEKIFSLKTSVPYIRYYFFVLGFVYIIKNYPKFIFEFRNALYLSLLIVSISAYLEFFFEINFLLDSKIEQHRISGLFGDELILGSYLARMLPLAILVNMYCNKRYQAKNIFKYRQIFLIIMFIAVLISGERTALLFSIISMTIYSLFYFNKFFQKIVVLSLIASLSIFIIMNNSVLKNRILDETKSQIVNKSNTKILNFFSIEHETHYKSAFKIFLDNPLLGSGPKTYRIVCKDKRYYDSLHSCNTHPHNIYFQLLAETGLAGFLVILLIFLFNLLNIIKSIFLDKFKNKIFVSLPFIICFFPFSPNGNFFNNWLSIISILSLSLSIYIFCYEEKNK